MGKPMKIGRLHSKHFLNVTGKIKELIQELNTWHKKVEYKYLNDDINIAIRNLKKAHTKTLDIMKVWEENREAFKGYD